MAPRPKKSDLIIAALRIANHDTVDETFPGGRAYKAAAIRAEIVALDKICKALEAGEGISPK